MTMDAISMDDAQALRFLGVRWVGEGEAQGEVIVGEAQGEGDGGCAGEAGHQGGWEEGERVRRALMRMEGVVPGGPQAYLSRPPLRRDGARSPLAPARMDWRGMRGRDRTWALGCLDMREWSLPGGPKGYLEAKGGGDILVPELGQRPAHRGKHGQAGVLHLGLAHPVPEMNQRSEGEMKDNTGKSRA